MNSLSVCLIFLTQYDIMGVDISQLENLLMPINLHATGGGHVTWTHATWDNNMIMLPSSAHFFSWLVFQLCGLIRTNMYHSIKISGYLLAIV